MSDITMPQLSDSMEQGTILSWLVADGAEIAVGDDLVEIESDKATVTYAAEVAGRVTLLVQEGDTIDVGTPIARTGAEAPAAAPETPAAAPAAAVADGGPAPATSGVEMPAAAGIAVTTSNGHGVKATPLARRIASVHGISLDAITGSGPLGRITQADVLAKAGIAIEPAPEVRAPAPAAAPAAVSAPVRPAIAAGAETQALTRLQAVIAKRMAETKATVPHFQVQTEVVMDGAAALRAQIKGTGETAPSFNDLIIKAAAVALRDHPLANGSYKGDVFELHPNVNVGMAVAAEGALIVPTIFDADEKSIGAIGREARRLAGAVRDGTVTPAELSGATFTVSNLGMFGMTSIIPVINAPQAAILGVGALRDVLARDADGEIVDRRLLTLTLSCDHRILYGAEASRFLSDIREVLENPMRLIL